MMINLKGRNFLTLLDYSPEEIRYLLDYATILKENKKHGRTFDLLKGKNIVLLFEKTSTRTRSAFEVAGYDEGAHVTFLSNSQFGKKESVEDTAKVLGRIYDGIEFRGNKQETVNILAEESGVPVWNGLTDEYHPTQALADLLTIQEHFGNLKHKKVAFVGDTRNNVANSLMIACAKLGIDYAGVGPEELSPDKKILEQAKKIATESGSEIIITSDIAKGVENADVIYTDIWVSMGEEDKIAERINLLLDYQVNQDLMDKTGKDTTIFLHCLPSFHDNKTTFAQMVEDKFGISEMEVTDEIFNSDQSLVFDQAENRLHTIKALICATLAEEPNRIFEKYEKTN